MNKRRLLISSLAVAILSTSFFILPAANAEPRDDRSRVAASEIHLETYSLRKAISTEIAGKKHVKTPLRELLVPLKEGVKAFCNFTPPVMRGLETIGNRSEYRAVIGFHFRLR